MNNEFTPSLEATYAVSQIAELMAQVQLAINPKMAIIGMAASSGCSAVLDDIAEDVGCLGGMLIEASEKLKELAKNPHADVLAQAGIKDVER